MRTFMVCRDEDESGISGTGIVAEGCEFSDGRTVISWIGERAGGVQVRPVVVYDSIQDALKVHGHRGKTRFVTSTRYGDAVYMDEIEPETKPETGGSRKS